MKIYLPGAAQHPRRGEDEALVEHGIPEIEA